MAFSSRAYDPHGNSFPNAAQLALAYDAERLRKELAAFRSQRGNVFSAASGQRVLPLRSIGGDPYRVDSGGPSLSGFQDTRWLEHLPAFREILAGLPAPVRGARLWAVGPGVRDTGLQSLKVGPPWGLCRLHLPVAVPSASLVVFVEESHHWAAGTLQFAASWRSHAIVNHDAEELIHLVVDLCHTEATTALFPPQLQEWLAGPQALRLRPAVPLPATAGERYRCRFRVPESFANWEGLGHQMLVERGGGFTEAEIEVRSAGTVLVLAGRPFCALEHIGQGEFRLCGWSDERTLQVSGPAEAAVVLRIREGGNTYKMKVPRS
ncbi:aspartyl/asparaginyl beta-hydroxylase domain-containing protein [Streptomyces sp. NPDC093707]|uniref:aspartyl/asparaginyl beta-hydroxylase domain-containing protein n=1 Tax=Streptomyces sp. NPDC093707 TaxID=3154984 RepID=UPI00344CE15F